MATRRQPLDLRGLLPGLSVATLLRAVTLAVFLVLWFSAPGADWQSVFSDGRLRCMMRFPFWQVSLSAPFSVGPAIFLARVFYRRRSPDRTLLLRLCAMTLILPVLVTVFGILNVHGRQGRLALLFHALGWQWDLSPYGLQGILLAHVSFNIPMATRPLLQVLESTPGEQRRIAAQFGIRGYAFFRFVEWPWMRRHIPAVAALIFMLCSASLATVLSLGGGPKATMTELVTYQALSSDYDPARVAMLALIQMLCRLVLVLLSQCLSKAVVIGTGHVRGWHGPDDRLHSRLSDGLLIGAALLLPLPLLLAVIIDEIDRNMPNILVQLAFWQALSTSLCTAIAAGLLSVTLTVMLPRSSWELRARQRPLVGQVMESSGTLILAIPGTVLVTGSFLLLSNSVGLPGSVDGIAIFTSVLITIPCALKVLENPMRDVTARYSMLRQLLGIEGFMRLQVVELRAFRRLLAQALALACVLSIGDFGVVALLGNEAFRILPSYLYQRIGAYRSQDGAVTALLLLLLCSLLFTLTEKPPGRDAKAQRCDLTVPAFTDALYP